MSTNVTRHSAESVELDQISGTSLSLVLIILGAVWAGALAAVLVVPAWLPGLSQSLLGPEPRAYWQLARTSGLVGYLLVWSSVVLGLLVTNKMARVFPGGPTAVDLHQFTSLLSIAFALFHGIILLGDRYINYNIFQILIPFGSLNYRPLWVGLGQLAFYLFIPVAFSFYVRHWLGYQAWRTIHFLAFIAYAFVTVHALLAGTDTASPFMLALYAAGGGVVIFFTIYRILTITKPA